MGYGIAWNRSLAPTEGYTNCLLVLMLSPFIKAGLDPLTVTRVFSYIGVAAIACMLYATARRRDSSKIASSY
jgi:hypothetical protein